MENIYYTNSGYFKPFAIFISVIYAPMLILATGCLVVDLGFWFIYLTVILAYIVLMVAILIFSDQKKEYIRINDSELFINHSGFCVDSNGVIESYKELTVASDDIIKIEYYRLSSFKAWISIVNCILPQCVFVTFKYKGREVYTNVGYLNRNEIESLCKEQKINLIMV